MLHSSVKSSFTEQIPTEAHSSSENRDEAN